jgi:cyclophilin family peptidyl-prolyl cis-trans isomerase
VPTEKRQRQKAGRQARLAAEQRVRKRRQNLRRGITAAIIIAAVVGISYLIFKPGSKSKTSASSTTTTSASSTTTQPAPPGGSGDKNPSAITTSADCPASFTATLNKPSYPSAPATTIDPNKTYTATVTTDVGSFTMQLEPKLAPKSVNSFVYLADHHYFDCIVFHRVIKTFMDQTGDPTGTGSGGPGYQYAEAGPSTASPQYPVGSVAMANSNQPSSHVPNTNGSQFFIVTGPEGETLPPDYTLFAKVTSGMNVVDAINNDGAPASNSQGTPAKLHRMVSVTVTES